MRGEILPRGEEEEGGGGGGVAEGRAQKGCCREERYCRAESGWEGVGCCREARREWLLPIKVHVREETKGC